MFKVMTRSKTYPKMLGTFIIISMLACFFAFTGTASATTTDSTIIKVNGSEVGTVEKYTNNNVVYLNVYDNNHNLEGTHQVASYNYSAKDRYTAEPYPNGRQYYYYANGVTIETIMNDLVSNFDTDDVSSVSIAADGITTRILPDSSGSNYGIFNTSRYYYPDGGGTASYVDPIIATSYTTTSGGSQSTDNCLRVFLGQVTALDRTNYYLVSNVTYLDFTID